MLLDLRRSTLKPFSLVDLSYQYTLSPYLHVLLGHAIQLQRGKLQDEEFRLELDCFFANLDRTHVQEQIDFTTKARRLEAEKGYKFGISHLRESAGSHSAKEGMIWRRRLALLHHLGIRSDVLILREGEQIPPHGHYRIVSGFYVLDGQVGIRHYDRVREVGGNLLVRPALSKVLRPGGYTTNSEYHHNIHWLSGLASQSFLFRVTVSGTPVQTFGGEDRTDERVYVDPTGNVDADGLILAPYVSPERAKELPFPACVPSVEGEALQASTER